MTVTELKNQLFVLSPSEKASAIETLTQTLTFGSLGIKKTPGVCGGDACIGNTRIPVWSLVNDRTLGMSDADILAAFPDLTAADLVNAWAYYQAHPEEIDLAIRENEEAMLELEAI